ncbi:MAG: hypothetical protein HYT63_00580 [Candidatus Yanofskybacteria bacterium]|nr:hypothetical protein [Candidatus Yanofskybacteria bacterium]
MVTKKSVNKKPKRVVKNSKNEGPTLAQKEALLREESIAAKRFEMLFGDLKKIPTVNIPKTDGASPFIIDVKDKNHPVISVINSPLVGTLASSIDSSDIFRNALRLAQARNNDAVVITGNLIYCLVQKYGKERPYRTQVLGLEPDPELLETGYPKAVVEEIGPLAKRLKDGKIVFMTIKVYLDHVFKMVHKKFLDEKGEPIFKGKVYIALGEIEESIAMYYANEALRAEVFQEKAFTHKKVNELRVRLRVARKSGDEKEENLLLEQINDWQVYDRILVLMGNVAPSHINERRRLMTNYLAYRIESDIPNAKVIGEGDTYIKVGSQIVSIVSDKTLDSVRGGLAGRLRRKIYNFTKANPGDKVPAVVLGAGLNPWGVGLYASFRIRQKKATLDDVRMTDVVQLLPCIDSNLYRETVRRMLKAKDRVARLASTTNFQSGNQTVAFFEPAPLIRIDWNRSEFLTNQDVFGSDGNLKKLVSGENPLGRMIYSYKEGCTHYGAAFVARYDSPDDPEGRYIKHHNQVLFEAFVRDNSPIHLYQIDGDIQHWLNYQVHKEVNPQWRDPEDLLAELTKIERNDQLSGQEKAKALKIRSMLNTVVAGVLQPEEQIEAFGKAMAPYAVFFKGVIERAKKAGIRMSGNLGIISIGQGNHNEHTFKGNTDVRFSEARLTRKEFLLFLLESGYNPEDLRACVVACQFGGVGMANGTFQASSVDKEAYEYSLFMKHKHGSSKTEDNMKTMITNFSHRGTTDNYEEGRFTINLGGDDHMGGHAVTRNAFHVKTGGQMFDGPFGLKLDFPKQNLFSTVWGVPAGGPSFGSCSVIRFDFRITRKLSAYKITLPENLFENPV